MNIRIDPEFLRDEPDDFVLQGREGERIWALNLDAIKRIVDDSPTDTVAIGARNWRAMFEQDGLDIQRRVAVIYETELAARALG